MLLVTTTHYKMLTLSLRLSSADSVAGSPQFNIVSDSLTELQDRHSRPSDAGQIVIVDPTSSLVCCHLYQGMLKCVTVNAAATAPHGQPQTPLTRSSGAHSFRVSARNSDKTFIDQFNLPIEEITIMSMVFLHGCQRPTLAVLYQDKKEIRHVKTYEFDLKINEKSETGWIQSGLTGASTCIAVPSPIGNCYVLGVAPTPTTAINVDPSLTTLSLLYTRRLFRRTPCCWRVHHLILQSYTAIYVSLDHDQCNHHSVL
jgi:DNA damage-binding protein 1